MVVLCANRTTAAKKKKPTEASIKVMVHGHDGHIPTLIERRGGSESPLVLSVNSRKETSYWIQISEIVKKRLKEAKATIENIEKVFCFYLRCVFVLIIKFMLMSFFNWFFLVESIILYF